MASQMATTPASNGSSYNRILADLHLHSSSSASPESWTSVWGQLGPFGSAPAEPAARSPVSHRCFWASRRTAIAQLPAR